MVKALTKLSVISLFLAIWSCSNNSIYDQYLPLAKNQWHLDSIANFDIEVDDTAAVYMVYLKMRHNQNYPYRNIWFFRTIKSKRGIEYTDTINYVIADESGKWLGKGIGELKHVIMPFKTEALQLKRSGKYTFEVQHGMKDSLLPGVTEIGLEVISHKPK